MPGLPDEAGRLQIIEIHTAKMRENGLLGQDVDLAELAAQTKNFSGAEIEGLVRAAQSTAMNRFIKVCSHISWILEMDHSILAFLETNDTLGRVLFRQVFRDRLGDAKVDRTKRTWRKVIYRNLEKKLGWQ